MNLPDPIPSRASKAHFRYHGRHPAPSCWHCQRGYAMCLSKITYATRAEGEAVVAEINQRENYVEPVTQYPCDWGTKDEPHWHVAHCRNSTDLKRQRRLWRRWKGIA